MLPAIHKRLQHVTVENNDFRKLLQTYNTGDYLVYCDPPYISGTRRGGKYQHEMTDDDHRELVELLMQYKGAVVLSGYNHDIYQPLEKAGWERLDYEVACHAAGNTSQIGIQ